MSGSIHSDDNSVFVHCVSFLCAGYDVWCTSTEFLDLCAGDSDEHAVLLCSYFLHGIRVSRTIESMKDAWVVVGRSAPEGATTWVLSRDRNESARLWDPNRGRVFDIGKGVSKTTSGDLWWWYVHPHVLCGLPGFVLSVQRDRDAFQR